MSAKKILYITQEIYPYLPESTVATTCRNLPQFVQESGREIRTFMPKFGSINERRSQLHEVIRLSGMNLIINDMDHPLIIKVASIQVARMQVYFIDNDDFFSRKHTVVDENNIEFADNDERIIFFVRGVLETVKKLRWIPDVVHCHGWMTALAPLYIKTAFADDPCFKKSKVVYSLYNDDFKGGFNDQFSKKMKFGDITNEAIKDFSGEMNYVKLTNLAIKYSDGVIQSEEGVNPEILSSLAKTDKKFLPYQSDAKASTEAINNFYDEF